MSSLRSYSLRCITDGVCEPGHGSPRRAHTTDAGSTFDVLATLGYTVQDVGRVTEVHLGRRGLGSVPTELQRFVNLDALWLNRNQLASLDGLLPPPPEGPARYMSPSTTFRRLRVLVLSHNRLDALGREIRALVSLEILWAGGNRLWSLSAVLGDLQPLRSLRQLDLWGNPLAEEATYRATVVHKTPSVAVLDRQVVTSEEREAAKQLLNEQRRGKRGGNWSASVSLVSGSSARDSSSLPPMEKRVAFGSHIPTMTSTGRYEHDSALRYVRKRAKEIETKSAAAEEVAAKAEAARLNAARNRRELFHSVWETVAEASKPRSTPAIQSGSTRAMSSVLLVRPPDRLLPATVPPPTGVLSSLFQTDVPAAGEKRDGGAAAHTAVAKVLDLAAQHLQAPTDAESRESFRKMYAEAHRFIPPHDDAVGAALRGRPPPVDPAGGAAAYTARVVAALWAAEDQRQLKRLGMAEPMVDVQNLRALVHAVEFPSNVAEGLTKCLAAALTSSYGDDGATKRRRRTSMSVVAVPHAAMVDHLAHSTAYVEARIAALQAQGAASLARGKVASAPILADVVKRVGVLTTHLNNLRAAGGRDDTFVHPFTPASPLLPP